MIVIGVDPGSKGAIVVYRKSGSGTEWLEDIYRDVTGKKLYLAIINWGPSHVFIEKAQSMPKQGIASAFTYGTGYGGLIAAADIAEVPYTLISPRIWSAKMHLGCDGDTPKEKSAQAFLRQFQKWADQLMNRNGKLHDGAVDAALIATYGARHVVSHKADFL